MDAAFSLPGIVSLNNEMDWLLKRIEDLINKPVTSFLPLPVLDKNSVYHNFVKEYKVSESDRVFVALAFASFFKPAVFLPFILAGNDPQKSVQYGGILKKDSSEFYPTIRTALYILSGNDDELLILLIRYINNFFNFIL